MMDQRAFVLLILRSNIMVGVDMCGNSIADGDATGICLKCYLRNLSKGTAITLGSINDTKES